jgi:hypothetical protein
MPAASNLTLDKPMPRARPSAASIPKSMREEPAPEIAGAPGVLQVIELILKRPESLEKLAHNGRWQAILVPRLLAVAVCGFALFGVAMSLVFSSARLWPRLTPLAKLVQTGGQLMTFEPLESPWSVLWNGAAGQLVFAYIFGLIAASGICLPSLYFYGLLSGIKPSLLDVLMQTLKAKAVTAVALVGILPIYAVLALGVAIFDLAAENFILWLGLILPFLAGLYGIRSLSYGFARLAAELPIECRHDRACFLNRLVLSWSAIYTAITPVMIFTVWEALQP